MGSTRASSISSRLALTVSSTLTLPSKTSPHISTSHPFLSRSLCAPTRKWRAHSSPQAHTARRFEFSSLSCTDFGSESSLRPSTYQGISRCPAQIAPFSHRRRSSLSPARDASARPSGPTLAREPPPLLLAPSVPESARVPPFPLLAPVPKSSSLPGERSLPCPRTLLPRRPHLAIRGSTRP